jgi:hypothetical protein
MIIIVTMIFLVGLLHKSIAPGRAGWKTAQQRSVGVGQSCADDRWQLREWLGPLLVLPLLAGAGVILEIQFVHHMLDRRQD